VSEPQRFDLELPGCTPEPLMAYLKALGILRLVSEQKDADTRGWWKDDVFRLRSTLGVEALQEFFLEEYRPTPIVVPWSGNDFFGVNWRCGERRYRKTPTASQAIEAVLATMTPRLEPYRRVLQECKTVLDECGIGTKEKMGKQKWTFIQTLRSTCTDPQLSNWLDAAAVDTAERFAPILGSGGGSDGNTHFSDNFIQNLWDVLPDFDSQRDSAQQPSSVLEVSRRQLAEALFGTPNRDRIAKRTSSLFDSGAVGGPNATQGMERQALSNPWNLILALEGTVSFAGAVSKRLMSNAESQVVFPFQVSVSITIREGLTNGEQGGSEIWLPIWTRPVQWNELLLLLQEGRAQFGNRTARTGVDMARAIASLGVDRGIRAFRRYAILKGRVGGENYNTAVSLGQFEVIERSNIDLLQETDSWIRRFRRAASDKNAPPRFGSALRRIDSAIFDFCKYGDVTSFQKILVALGVAERELVRGGRFGEASKLPSPLAGLSEAWIDAADDGSVEFTIARALVSVFDPEKKTGPFRANLEPVDWKERCRKWAEKDRAVVWNTTDLTTNLLNVLERRLLDGDRTACEHPPLASLYTIPVAHIAAFIAGHLDDRRIEELIWGLLLVMPRRDRNKSRITEAPPLRRDYALLKLLFLPGPLVADRHNGMLRWRLAKSGELGLIIRQERRIPALLRAGRVAESCRIAAQRLLVSGLSPMPGPLPTGIMRDDTWTEHTIEDRLAKRLAAALLIPISTTSVNYLVHLVCRADASASAEALAYATEGETE
jgi:CRISPR-associated protein Csx17